MLYLYTHCNNKSTMVGLVVRPVLLQHGRISIKMKDTRTNAHPADGFAINDDVPPTALAGESAVAVREGVCLRV
jgi:hypothetical protein